MIYEFRTYRVAPRSVAEVERIFAEAYEHRKKYSELTASWHTEIGPLNEIVQVWAYQDLGERARIRAEAAKDPNGPPKIRDYVVSTRSQIVVPFPFLPDVRPGKLGPVFELRYYTYKPGAMPQVRKNWEAALPARLRLSPLLIAGAIEFGHADGFIHVWAYQSLDQRMKVRAEAIAARIWPPAGGEDLVTQENKILLPAAFSPLS
jgi:hypothetical protein